MPEPLAPEIDPDRRAFIRVRVGCIPAIVLALNRAGFEEDALAVAEFSRQYTDPVSNEDRLYWLEKAEAVAKDGEIEFDLDGAISGSEGGQYVLGWVWVDGDEEDDEDEPE
jgi:hypothetical protein